MSRKRAIRMIRAPHRQPPADGFVEIACELRTVREKAIAIWAGRLEPVAGGGVREVWVWIPRSRCTWLHLDENPTGRISLRVKEKIAIDRGLYRPAHGWADLHRATPTPAPEETAES